MGGVPSANKRVGSGIMAALAISRPATAPPDLGSWLRRSMASPAHASRAPRICTVSVLLRSVSGAYAVGSTTAGFARQGPLLIDYRERSSRQLLLGEKMTRAMTSNGFAIGLFLPDRLLGGYGPGCGENHQRECNG